MGSSRGTCYKTAVTGKFQENFLHVFAFEFIYRASGHEDEVNVLPEFELMEPKCFAHQTTGATATNGISKFLRGDDSQTRTTDVRVLRPVQNQTAADAALALFLDPGEVAPPDEALITPEGQPTNRGVRHVGIRPG